MSRRIKKRKLEDEEQKINDGDQDTFFPDKAREEMETMWEVIKIDFNIFIPVIEWRYVIKWCLARDVFSDTTNLSLSTFDEGISQYTSIVHVRDGEDAADTASLEATGKRYDMFAEVNTRSPRLDILYVKAICIEDEK